MWPALADQVGLPVLEAQYVVDARLGHEERLWFTLVRGRRAVGPGPMAGGEADADGWEASVRR